MAEPPEAEPRRTVLVVDDEPEICRLLDRVLAAEYAVTTVTDPVEALRRIRDGERFDLIISDVMMPRLTGIALLSAINEADRAQGERLVFLTASVLPSEIEATFRGLPNVVLRKPIGIAALRGFVKGRF
jgi:CheY-like chemotaxis protein